ncbi:MAG: GHKL domain-containing protein [Alphaproteobacteria bacterium]|nr:GHKL domain-containing protein [Alphaproteobacteria bacterium]
MLRKLSLRPVLLTALSASVISVFILWETARQARLSALDEINKSSASTLALVVENLSGELAKYSFQPRLLSTSSVLVDALNRDPDDPDLRRVSEELARINGVTGALATYLMNRDGLTIAASNWASEGPFVGRNFNFRPYFQQAMHGRLGRMFAMGTTSGERGYFFAYPVRDQGRIVGAVVVKMDVSILERGWRAEGHEILVVDDAGVVFLSSRPEWRLKSLRPLSAEQQQRLDRSRLYADEKIDPLHFVLGAGGDMTRISVPNAAAADGDGSPRRAARTFLVQETAMAAAGWRVMILSDASSLEARVRIAMLVAGFMLASLFLLALNIYQRRKRLNERLELQEAARGELEEKVVERTQDLSRAVAQLRAEVSERERAEAHLRRTQDELIQASKLAALGQLSAGVSHELNQPLTAIRSYAENARVFLSRQDSAMTDSNLGRIAEMCERMARIIRNLRTYARNEPVGARPTRLHQPIRDALALLDGEFRKADIEVNLDLGDEDILAIGGDVRLQQVFVNLFSNAMDAMEKSPLRRIDVTIHREPGEVAIEVSDTGPGIAPEDLDRVFDPFFTTKDVGKGTGLGLSISYGIVNQFGGRIEVANRHDGGTTFTVRLLAADQQREAAE